MNFTRFLGIYLVCRIDMLGGILLASNPLGVMIPAALRGLASE